MIALHGRVLVADDEAAAKELRELLQEEPECIEACLMLAALYRDLGLSRRAQAHYHRVLDLQPGHVVATAELRTLPLGDLVGSRTHASAQA